MSDPTTRNVTSDIQQIIESAARLGIELDENDTVECETLFHFST